ncbi:MAG: hypothetical protein WD077_13955 [Bacteroidia bacterium]
MKSFSIALAIVLLTFSFTHAAGLRPGDGPAGEATILESEYDLAVQDLEEILSLKFEADGAFILEREYDLAVAKLEGILNMGNTEKPDKTLEARQKLEKTREDLRAQITWINATMEDLKSWEPVVAGLTKALIETERSLAELKKLDQSKEDQPARSK